MIISFIRTFLSIKNLITCSTGPEGLCVKFIQRAKYELGDSYPGLRSPVLTTEQPCRSESPRNVKHIPKTK